MELFRKIVDLRMGGGGGGVHCECGTAVNSNLGGDMLRALP